MATVRACDSWWVALAAIGLIACSRESRTECANPGGSCSEADRGTSGSGSGGIGAAGGAGVGSGGRTMLDAGGVDSGLRVHVEDVGAMRLEVVTLRCAGDCVDITAVARGGHAPYTFSWEDGSRAAERHVCLDASATLKVSATDTPITGDEFVEYAGKTVSAEVMVTVLDCPDTPGDGGMPGRPCEDRADPGSFDPVVKWSWIDGGSVSTPLVANLTDDNGDGVIDTLDTPDVVLVNMGLPRAPGSELVVLDGDSGGVHVRIPSVDGFSTPALGDIDGDKQADIVMAREDGALAVFHGDGSPIWATQPLALPSASARQIALADLDHDGAPEIIAGEGVFDRSGDLLWRVPPQDSTQYSSPVAADLDGDGYLEVIWGAIAYRRDGSEYYRNADLEASDPNAMGFFAAVADLDGDESPEIVISSTRGPFVLDYAGATLSSRNAPSNADQGAPFPPAIADLDGDATPEILLSDGDRFTAYSPALEVRWSRPVGDTSGLAAGTAFDFLGDGTAEAMYGDETVSWVFDGLDGHVVFQQSRTSGTLIEYPSVADVDNDGSADILLVSNRSSDIVPEFTVRVISDRDARWIPARRIFNQESYHVTNVNEDGTIPAHELPPWKLNNSFRAQGQIHRSGELCLPERADR